MKIRYNIIFKEIQPLTIINHINSKKRSYFNIPLLMRRQKTWCIFKFQLIFLSKQISYRILKFPNVYAFRNKKKNLRRAYCQIKDFVSLVLITLNRFPKISLTVRGIIPIQNFCVFISEQSFQNLIYENKSIRTKLERLKNDLSIFQKNISIKEQKTHYLIKNQLLKRLIPVLDMLERAKNFDSHQIKSKKLKKFNESFCKNIQMVYNSFIQNTGLKIIMPSIGDIFNEHFQTIIGIVYEKDKKNNSILEVVTCGYALNDEIISPSQVIISTINPKHPNLMVKQNLSVKKGFIFRLSRKSYSTK